MPPGSLFDGLRRADGFEIDAKLGQRLDGLVKLNLSFKSMLSPRRLTFKGPVLRFEYVGTG